MRNLLLIILLFTASLSFAQLSAASYGATPNDTTDDTSEINDAIAAAIASGNDLFIPAGSYKVNLFSPYGASFSSNKSLRIDRSTENRIRIFGEKGTKITTNIASGVLFYVYYKNIDCTIENIFFENTHAVTTNQTTGIQIFGTSSNQVKNFTVKNCRFEGFSTAILAQGVVGLTIENNIFEAPLGHDNAQNNDQPAVFVWLQDNANGQCYDVIVKGNFANGFTGTDITTTTTKRPMDGFLFGYVYGLVYANNVTKNLAHEHVLISTNVTYPDLNVPVLIEGNFFNQVIPAGSMWLGAPLKSSYGVRIDCDNVSITNNNFYNFTVGIMIRPYDFPSLVGRNYIVTDNKFFAPKDTSYDVKQAINIQGAIANRARNILVTNNFIDVEFIKLKNTRSLIQIYDSENIRCFRNFFFTGTIYYNSYTLNAILIGRSAGAFYNDNYVSGLPISIP